MDSAVTQVASPAMPGLNAYALPGLPASEISYSDLLASRPWETSSARQILRVPNRLLPHYCPVITHWVVLSGATSAGKTTIIRALEQQGFPVLHEVATEYVKSRIKEGRTVEELRRNDRWYREMVFTKTLEAETKLLEQRAHRLLFLDRSVLDSLSFHRGSGYDPHELLHRLPSYRYFQVFHCNILPFVHDGLRTHNEDRRKFLDAALERDYLALGYRPIRVPYMPVKDRVAFILNELLANGPIN